MAIGGVLDGLGMYLTHRAHSKASAFSRMISQQPPPSPGYGFPLTAGVLYGSMFSGAGFGCGAGGSGFGGMYGMGPYGMMNPYGFGGIPYGYPGFGGGGGMRGAFGMPFGSPFSPLFGRNSWQYYDARLRWF